MAGKVANPISASFAMAEPTTALSGAAPEPASGSGAVNHHWQDTRNSEGPEAQKNTIAFRVARTVGNK
jgi:hypothetical protein